MTISKSVVFIPVHDIWKVNKYVCMYCLCELVQLNYQESMCDKITKLRWSVNKSFQHVAKF